MSSYFLAAATEVKAMVFQYITQPTDLKTLCLVSKEISAMARPVLYHQVDLTPRERTQDEHRDDLDPIPLEQITRIQALLSNKQNLLFIRILITSECGTVVTNMLDELLTNLADNQLLELHYGNRNMLPTNRLLLRTENCFPTEKQMKLLWTHQRKLQTCHSKHLSTLSKALTTSGLEASDVLHPVRELVLIEEQLDLGLIDLLKRSLQNGYMPALRRLKLGRWYSDRGRQILYDLFATQGFSNLTEIYLRSITFKTTLRLANCPLLRSMTILNCRIDGAATLSTPHLLQIKSLYYAAEAEVNQYKLLAPIMNRIQGLESLILELISPETEDEDFSEEHISEFRLELASALGMHKGSLTELVVCEEKGCETSLTFAGEDLFRAIEGCKKLYRLAVSLGVHDAVTRYSRLIEDLPCISSFWLMHCFDYCPDYEDEAEIPIQFKKALPAKSNLRFFAYNWACYYRQENENGGLTDQDEPDANTAGAAFKRISWKKSNAIFYNKYPCIPLLPANHEPSDKLLAE